jgi:hypothetical protein
MVGLAHRRGRGLAIWECGTPFFFGPSVVGEVLQALVEFHEDNVVGYSSTPLAVHGVTILGC